MLPLDLLAIAAWALILALLLDVPGLVITMAVCGLVLVLVSALRGFTRAPTDGPLAAVGVCLVVSWGLSPYTEASPWPYAAWVLTATGVAHAASASRVFRILVAGLVTAGATLLAYSVLIRLTTPGSERLIVYPAIAHWGQYPELGIVGVIVAPMAAAVMLGSRLRTSAAAAAVLLTAIVVGLVLTFSRAAWVAAAIALVPLAAASRRRLAALVVGAAVVVVVAGVQQQGGRPGLADLSPATQTRSEAWLHALDLWRARPLVGWGPGTYRAAHVQLFGPTGAPAGSSAHNLPLQVGVECGLLGLLAITWLALRLLEPAWHVLRDARAVRIDRMLPLGVAGAMAGVAARLLVDTLDPISASQRVFFATAIVVGLMAACRPEPVTEARPQ